MVIKKLFEELEKEIKKQNLYQRCPDNYQKCSQCIFWNNFDALKENTLELEDLK